ncbi:MAG: DNA repair protein RadA [Alphaproteobacteria bacterium]
MVKRRGGFVCQACGAISVKWRGQCAECGAWESLKEHIETSAPPVGGKSTARRRPVASSIEFLPLIGQQEKQPRLSTNMFELDRVLGGGMVKGSAMLIGGDPGIGKSTLLLQAMANIAYHTSVAYISGEESIEQIRLRAERLGIADSPLLLATSDDARDIAQLMMADNPPKVMVIDSIQTLYVGDIDAAPGTIQQVRASAQILIRNAKNTGTAIFLVGHVTKDGAIAGPKLLEHMVDAVLYFEGERGSHYRLLRCHKNRFGSADEIGVFDMTEKGLLEVSNPSNLFLSSGGVHRPGAVVFGSMEGSRPLLLEMEALIAPSSLAYPRRTVVGFDANRLAMILAILETRAGIKLSTRDVFLNVAGGMATREPASDLAVATALISAHLNKEMPEGVMVFGELGLSGDVRGAQKPALRIKEAVKMGFDNIWLPGDKVFFDKLHKELSGVAFSSLPIKKIDDVVKMF